MPNAEIKFLGKPLQERKPNVDTLEYFNEMCKIYQVQEKYGFVLIAINELSRGGKADDKLVKAVAEIIDGYRCDNVRTDNVFWVGAKNAIERDKRLLKFFPKGFLEGLLDSGVLDQGVRDKIIQEGAYREMVAADAHIEQTLPDHIDHRKTQEPGVIGKVPNIADISISSYDDPEPVFFPKIPSDRPTYKATSSYPDFDIPDTSQYVITQSSQESPSVSDSEKIKMEEDLLEFAESVNPVLLEPNVGKSNPLLSSLDVTLISTPSITKDSVGFTKVPTQMELGSDFVNSHLTVDVLDALSIVKGSVGEGTKSVIDAIAESDSSLLGATSDTLRDSEVALLNLDDLSIPCIKGNVTDPEEKKKKFSQIERFGNLPIALYDENGLANLQKQINEASLISWRNGDCQDKDRKGHPALISYTFDGTHYRAIVAQEGRVSVNFVSFKYMLRQSEELKSHEAEIALEIGKGTFDDMPAGTEAGTYKPATSEDANKIALNTFYQSKLKEINKATNLVVANTIDNLDKIYQDLLNSYVLKLIIYFN